jgi:hypothetical protein
VRRLGALQPRLLPGQPVNGRRHDRRRCVPAHDGDTSPIPAPIRGRQQDDRHSECQELVDLHQGRQVEYDRFDGEIPQQAGRPVDALGDDYADAVSAELPDKPGVGTPDEQYRKG